MSDVRRAVKRFRQQIEPRRDVWPGWMVDYEGTGNASVTDEPGYVYVMLDRGQGSEGGDVVKARARIRPVAGWGVLVGTTRQRPWEYLVLDVDTEAMGGAIDGDPILEPHAKTHQWGHPEGGDDSTRPRFLQLYDFGVWPGGGLTVNVLSGIYNPSGTQARSLYVSNVSLSGTQPDSDQRYVLVCLSPTGTFELVPGIVKSFLTLDDIPPAPSDDHWELAAVKLRSTDTQVTMTPSQPDIIDLRFARIGWPHKKGSTATGTNAWTGLADTPGDFSGFAGYASRVNTIENALEFFDPATQGELDAHVADTDIHHPWSITSPAVFYTDSGLMVEYDTIQDCIDNTSGDIVILLPPGNHTGNISFSSRSVSIFPEPAANRQNILIGATVTFSSGSLTVEGITVAFPIYQQGDSNLYVHNCRLSVVDSSGSNNNAKLRYSEVAELSGTFNSVTVAYPYFSSAVPASLDSVEGLPASTAYKGIVELATDAETITGSSDSVVTTPGNVRARELDLGDMLLTEADAGFVFGPDWKIRYNGTFYSVHSRLGRATLTGALHFEPSRWSGFSGIVIEEGTTNLIENPSFETNTSTWNANGSASISRVTTEKYFGNYGLKVETTASTTDGIKTDAISISSSTDYTASIWIKGESGIDHRLRLYGDVSGTLGTASITANGEWQRVTLSVTTGGTESTVLFYVQNFENTANDFYVDGAQLEEQDYATSYCDGSLGQGYSWSGTAHASTSSRTSTEFNMDDILDIVSEQDTLTFRMVVQAPYDHDATWPNTGDFNRILDTRGSSSNERIVIAYGEDTEAIELYINGSWRLASSAQTFDAGDWLEIVVTIDFANDNYYLYINGALEDSDTSSWTLTAPTLTDWILGAEYNGSNYWGGFTFAECAVWDKVLTPSEIAGLYSQQRPIKDAVELPVRPSVPDAYYYDEDNDRIYYMTPGGAKYVGLT